MTFELKKLAGVYKMPIRFLKKIMHIGNHILVHNPKKQKLDLYWSNNFADVLECWGEGNAWDEIQSLLRNCNGKILDIACGTGKVISILQMYKDLDLYGCDISDLLISKAIEKGISKEKLVVCDATRTQYSDDYFAYSYSIGSLEHFTSDGIVAFVSECYRITKMNSFHMIPVSKSGKNEGWMTTKQSFFNNSENWWIEKFKTKYKNVEIRDSIWNDNHSVGKWFICSKERSYACQVDTNNTEKIIAKPN